MSIIKAGIKQVTPKQAIFIAKNPATNLPFFETEDGKTIECKIFVVGRHSKEFIDYANEIHSEGKDFNYREILQRCVVGWENNGFFEQEFSAEALKELAEADELDWLHAQLGVFINNNVNFF